jgi:phosphate transport system permease protein
MAERETKPSGSTSNEPAPPLPPPSIGGESVEVPRHRSEDDEAPPEDVRTEVQVSERGAASVRAGEPTVFGSAEPLAVSTLEGAPPVSGAGLISTGRPRIGDRLFHTVSAGSGLFVVLLIGLVAAFLIDRAAPAIADDKSNFLFSRDWSVDTPPLHFGIVDLLWVTVIISLVAMVIAVPIAIGIALFITQYAPKRIARPVAYIVDLLAAIPSIIYGIWGIIVLAPKLRSVQHALYHLGGFPVFRDENVDLGTIFNGGVVLAVMILPIITAIGRDVFERTPSQNIEAAWALGATRWEMIRMAVLPYGRPGLISGSMLGLGRALGETIAVMLILSKPSPGAPFSFSIFNGGETFASKIANSAAEFNQPQQTGAFIAAGLVLFVLTFAVNAAARSVVSRRKEFV